MKAETWNPSPEKGASDFGSLLHTWSTVAIVLCQEGCCFKQLVSHGLAVFKMQHLGTETSAKT